MAAATNRRRRGLGELSGAEYTTIVLSVLAATFGALYAVFIVIFLISKPPDCGESHWTYGPIDMFAILGVFAALGGVGAGVWAAVFRPRMIGLATIIFNLVLIAGGLVLAVVSFQHAGGFQFCDI